MPRQDGTSKSLAGGNATGGQREVGSRRRQESLQTHVQSPTCERRGARRIVQDDSQITMLLRESLKQTSGGFPRWPGSRTVPGSVTGWEQPRGSMAAQQDRHAGSKDALA